MKKILLAALLFASAALAQAQTIIEEGDTHLLIDHSKRVVIFQFPEGIRHNEEIALVSKSGERLKTIKLSDPMLQDHGYTLNFAYLESLGSPLVKLMKDGNVCHTFELAETDKNLKPAKEKPETATYATLSYSETTHEVTVSNRKDIQPGSVIEVVAAGQKLMGSTKVPATASGRETFAVKTPGLPDGSYVVKIDNKVIGSIDRSSR